MKSCFVRFCRLVCLPLSIPLYVLELVGLFGLYKRIFPMLAYNITFSYNDKMHEVKRELFRNVAKFSNSEGGLRLLEVGCGSGANFQFYPYGCTVTCTDPNAHFERYLRLSMDANKHLTYDKFLVLSGEDMQEVEDECVDVVVCTLVLCSVKNVPKVLQEVRRILRTGGAFYFLEGGVSDSSPPPYFFQYVFERGGYYLGDPPLVTRTTWKDGGAAGFAAPPLKHIEALGVGGVIRPHPPPYSIK
ncbi:methyltransferase-like protein 7A [Nothobranchius furzeri]|uniref:Methyltransferase-like protein 7A n=1 Tax=Nothobranchius furzeri TaxID=105023 RepID=A0A9D2XRH0_NOTFU|nr:methyltransferase-like protein 7A [Nothobranchius furzeri]